MYSSLLALSLQTVMPRQAAARPTKRPRRADGETKELDQLENSLQEGQDAAWAASKTFAELPLSQYTKAALLQHKFLTLTAIQKAALPPALVGRDVLGAAKTGSGKTLSFLLPVRMAVACCTHASYWSWSAETCWALPRQGLARP